MFPKDKPRVKALFADNGVHHFHDDRLGKGMFWLHASKNGKPADGPHVEIFYEPVYTSTPEHLLPLQRCDFYGTPVWCPKLEMLDVWFATGWHTYGGGHYHGKGRCTIYDKGKRIMKNDC